MKGTLKPREKKAHSSLEFADWSIPEPRTTPDFGAEANFLPSTHISWFNECYCTIRIVAVTLSPSIPDHSERTYGI